MLNLLLLKLLITFLFKQTNFSVLHTGFPRHSFKQQAACIIIIKARNSLKIRGGGKRSQCTRHCKT